MQQLIDELTKLCITARVYLELRAKNEGLLPAAPEAEKPAIEAPKRGRKPKPETVEPEPMKPAAEPVKAAEPARPKDIKEALGIDGSAMGEKESLDQAYKLAGAFITVNGARDESKAQELRDYIMRTFGKKAGQTSISALTHPQRVEFVEYLRSLDAEPAGAL